jgi:hypothetical protein
MDLKNARGIVDRPNRTWLADKPAGEADLACLEAQYADKMAFVLGMTLPASCKTHARVLFIIGMYEAFGSEFAYEYGKEHPEFFRDLDPVVVAKTLHSTKVPRKLSLKTLSNLSAQFCAANPHRTLRVMILGAGCGEEGKAILEENHQKRKMELVNVDILPWPQTLPGALPTQPLNVVAPAEPYLGLGAERVHVVIASISASRSLAWRCLTSSTKFTRHYGRGESAWFLMTMLLRPGGSMRWST